MEYRQSLTASFLLKFFAQVSNRQGSGAFFGKEFCFCFELEHLL